MNNDWFDQIYQEYNHQKQAFFAFSLDQVQAEGVSPEEFAREWTRVGNSALHLKKTIAEEFLQRMKQAHDAWQASLPELRVHYVEESVLDYPAYRAIHALDEIDVASGQYLVDIEYNPPGEATKLYTATSEEFPEPGHPLAARIVYEPLNV